MTLQLFRRVAFCFLLLLAPSAAPAADVLQEVPNDVLGFVVVHHLSGADSKAKWLSLEMQNRVFSPLAFLKQITNVQDGLNRDGDFLIVAYPDPHGDKSRLRFGVWLPVSDYGRFSKSIGASSVDGISTVTIAGEDLLVAKRGEWALMMDTDQRERLTQLVAASGSAALQPQVAGWKKWIDGNDVTVLAYATGVHELLSWVDDSDGDGKPDEGSDDVFGAAPAQAPGRVLAVAAPIHDPQQGLAGLLDQYRKWTAASPAIAHTIEQATTVACGLRINPGGESGGSAVAGLRVAFNDGFETESIAHKSGLPYSIYDDSGFAIAYAGQLPKSVIETLASGYLQTIVADMKKEEHTDLDEDAMHQLNEAVEQAAGEIRYAVVLAQPGSQPAPVYTNNYVLLRVSSAADFVSRSTEVMRLWNKANRDADGETKLIFAIEEAKLGDRAAHQYTLDFATMLGGPALPEVRQAMEKLFGPGGKLRLWVVPTDDHTVLLAQGTQEQVAAVLKLYDRKQPIEWNRGALSSTNRLLPAESDWRLFFDPHRYFDWQRREAMAVTGVPVIGGPLVRSFRDSPAVAVAGGFHDQEMWIDAVALAPTLKGAYEFLSPPRRANIQLRIQRAPR